jgi:hypothetical protein
MARCRLRRAAEAYSPECVEGKFSEGMMKEGLRNRHRSVRWAISKCFRAVSLIRYSVTSRNTTSEPFAEDGNANRSWLG